MRARSRPRPPSGGAALASRRPGPSPRPRDGSGPTLLGRAAGLLTPSPEDLATYPPPVGAGRVLAEGKAFIRVTWFLQGGDRGGKARGRPANGDGERRSPRPRGDARRRRRSQSTPPPAGTWRGTSAGPGTAAGTPRRGGAGQGCAGPDPRGSPAAVGSDSRAEAAGQRPGPIAASAAGAGVMGRAVPGQGSRPLAGSRPAPRVLFPALAGARQARRGLGGAGVPGSWRPAPLTALFLVTILSSLRAMRAISSSLPIIASGAAPPAPTAPASTCRPRRLPRPSPPPAPAAADAVLRAWETLGSNPRPPRSPRCILGHVVQAPTRLPRSLPFWTTTPRIHVAAHSFLGIVVLARTITGDLQKRRTSSPTSPGAAPLSLGEEIRWRLRLGRAFPLLRGPRDVPVDPPLWSGRGREAGPTTRARHLHFVVFPLSASFEPSSSSSPPPPAGPAPSPGTSL